MRQLSVTKGDILLEAVTEYLRVKPFFYGFIRPQEVLFFRCFKQLLQEPILDFGADDGFFASLAFPPHAEIIGLDLAGTGIASKAAKKVYQRAIVYDGGVIPLKAEAVGTVVSNCVLEHISHISLSLSEQFRVLRAGGYSIHTVMSSVWNENLWGGKLGGNRYLKWLAQKQVHHQLLSEKGWRQQFEKAGFEVMAVYGYLSPHISKLLEIGHYLALPQLGWYRLMKRWTIFGRRSRTSLLTKGISTLIEGDAFSAPQTASALCFVLKKPKNRA